MSYQLVFWKSGRLPDATAAWRQLQQGHVDEVAAVDRAQVEGALVKALGEGWLRDGWLWSYRPDADGNGPGVDVAVEPQYVTADCYGLEAPQMNEIIDAMLSLGMRLYDPQTGERFN